MAPSWERRFKPNLLCIAPPPFYPVAPPAGPAYLLGYLEAKGCHEFDFLDLRLGVPDSGAPTFATTGAFAESYVSDIPDLPLVLDLVRRFQCEDDLAPITSPLFERYCLERGISPTYVARYLRSLDEYLDHVFSQLPHLEFVGFSTWTENFLATLMAAARLKRRPNPPTVVAGGPQVSASEASAKIGLRTRLFDAVALGEGEETLLDLYRQHASGHPLSPSTPGTLGMLAPGSFKKNPRALLKPRDLPAPSFDRMHLAAYQKETGSRVLTMQMSRGCTDKCEFCSEWVFWERYRVDDPHRMVEQIETLQHRYGADFILFVDSLLNGVPKRLVAFAEALLDRKIDIGWSGFMRADMTPEMARLIAKAGCHDVFIGIESFSDETLERMRKRRTEAENVQAAIAFLEAGIDVTAGFVPGFPGDSRESFLHSASVFRDLQQRYPGRIAVQDEPFVVQPGAPLFRNMAQMGLEPIGWAEEYLDIVPDLQEITSHVYCSVEGENQGLERAGRASIVRTLLSDAPANGGFTFEKCEEEVLETTRFEFVHHRRGWYVATRKVEAGHVYSLIVTEGEKAELEDLELETDLARDQHEVVSKLRVLERRHVVAPDRRRLRLVRVRHAAEPSASTRYAVSPFVVARRAGGEKGQLLCAHFVNGQPSVRPGIEASILQWARKAPRTRRHMFRSLPGWSAAQKRGRLDRSLDELVKLGLLVTC